MTPIADALRTGLLSPVATDWEENIMKHRYLIVPLAVLSLAAAAQTSTDRDPVRIAGQALKIELPAHFSKIDLGGFDVLQGGSYYLSNGGTLHLTMWGNRKYAQVSGMPKREVVAVGTYQFVALDKTLKISLTAMGNDDVTGYLLMTVPRSPTEVAGNVAPRIARVEFAAQ